MTSSGFCKDVFQKLPITISTASNEAQFTGYFEPQDDQGGLLISLQSTGCVWFCRSLFSTISAFPTKSARNCYN
jgi:hypothetical protein